jgi:hypothetical protein
LIWSFVVSTILFLFGSGLGGSAGGPLPTWMIAWKGYDSCFVSFFQVLFCSYTICHCILWIGFLVVLEWDQLSWKLELFSV